MMNRRLAIALAVTDVAFLAYWAVAAAALAGLISLPAALMYAGYEEPRVVAWNWSFLPIDIAFSVTGLLAVHAARRGDLMWRPLCLISLVLTMVAGLIAHELGLDLYQVDLSKIVSKFIGETEKQLAMLFDAAESGHSIILFDEADSLFAKRSEV